MTKALLMILLMCVASCAPSEPTSARQEEGVPASAQSEGSTGPNQTAAVSQTEISCTDEVLKPFWNEMKNTREFRAREKDFHMDADCRSMLDVQKADLNGDGQSEFILWGNNGNLCGATGNCEMWIYEIQSGQYTLLLQSNGYNGEEKWFEIDKLKSKGYFNLVVKGHATGYETTEHYYSFNGKEYVERKCLVRSFSVSDEKPSISTCEEAWSR